MDTLGELFSSRIRASVLAYLVAREEARFSLTELSRALGLSVSSIQHECYKLERLGVLKGRREGASRRYWLDREVDFVPVLMWLVITVIGQTQVLSLALHGIEGLEGAVLTRDGDKPTITLIGNLGLQSRNAHPKSWMCQMQRSMWRFTILPPGRVTFQIIMKP